MNKMVIASTMLVSLFAANSMAASAPVAGSANAATSNSKATAHVSFEGEIVASTCIVNTTLSDATVTLPTVNDQQFGTAAGNTIGDTKFTLAFKECPAATGHSYIVAFTGNYPTGNSSVLEATRGGQTAADVGIQVSQVSGPAIDFAPGQTELTPASKANDELTLDLIAKYEQLTNVIPAAGKITASMNYTVIYK